MNLASNILLESKSISKSFGGINAVNEVSLKLNKGQITGIKGGNGSGKTTLLNLFSLLVEQDSGDLIIKNTSSKNLRSSDLYQLKIARSFQHSRNWKTLSLHDNLVINYPKYRYTLLNYLFNYSIINKNVFAFNEKIKYFLEYFMISSVSDSFTNVLNTPVSEFSLGEQRLIELIRIFISEPDIQIGRAHV
jgi:branched-chain amino acid transport system ATP-binding protein